MSNWTNEKQLFEQTSILSRVRENLMRVEANLASANPHSVTGSSINRMESQLRQSIMQIRGISSDAARQGLRSKERVLTNLREACDQLNHALDVLESQGRTREFYQQLHFCQECLRGALRGW